MTAYGKSTMIYLSLLLIGLFAGLLSGLFGIGGGIVMVPALILFIHMAPHQAIGTSLAAMIPPVGLLAAMEYYRAGHINLKYAALVALGLFIGAWVSAKFAISLPPQLVKKLFAGLLVLVAAKMIFFDK